MRMTMMRRRRAQQQQQRQQQQQKQQQQQQQQRQRQLLLLSWILSSFVRFVVAADAFAAAVAVAVAATTIPAAAAAAATHKTNRTRPPPPVVDGGGGDPPPPSKENGKGNGEDYSGKDGDGGGAAVAAAWATETNLPAAPAPAAQASHPSQQQPRERHSKWKWDPSRHRHPCSIRLQLTLDELYDKFGPKGVPRLYTEPIVLLVNETSILQRDRKRKGRKQQQQPPPQQPRSNQDDDEDGSSEYPTTRRRRQSNALFYDSTRSDRISSGVFPTDFNVTLSSSNALSERRRTVPLTQYLDEMISTGETLPTALSNESWYLFGETYEPIWHERLLRYYVLPPCSTCNNSVGSKTPVALAFGIGNRGSGVQWHVHGPGFGEAVHGRKHWVLYPPGPQPPVSYHKDQSSRQWMEYAYTALPPNEKPLECTLNPGDLIYFPDKWWHATINLDPYTAFISSFTTEHVATLDEEDGIRADSDHPDKEPIMHADHSRLNGVDEGEDDTNAAATTLKSTSSVDRGRVTTPVTTTGAGDEL